VSRGSSRGDEELGTGIESSPHCVPVPNEALHLTRAAEPICCGLMVL